MVAAEQRCIPYIAMSDSIILPARPGTLGYCFLFKQSLIALCTASRCVRAETRNPK